MGLDNIRLLIGWAFLLLLAELLDQGHGLALQTTGKLAPNSSRAGEIYEVSYLLLRKVISLPT